MVVGQLWATRGKVAGVHGSFSGVEHLQDVAAGGMRERGEDPVDLFELDQTQRLVHTTSGSTW